MKHVLTLSVCAIALSSAAARAAAPEEDGYSLIVTTADPSLSYSPIPTATFRAVLGWVVRLGLAGGPDLVGQLIAIEPDTVTLVLLQTGDVYTVAREQVIRLRTTLAPQPFFSMRQPLQWDAPAPPPPARAVTPRPAPRVRPPATPVAVEAPHVDTERHLGAHLAALGVGVMALDAEYRPIYFLFSASVLATVLSPNSIGGATIGLGYLRELSVHWALHLFVHISPTTIPTSGWFIGSTDSPTSTFAIAVGVGAGLRYTSDNGFTLGVHLPIIGTAFSGDSSSVSDYHRTAIISMPLVSIGYRY